MSTAKILVLGATGTVGSALVQQLVDAGHDVRAATRDASKATGPAPAVSLDLTQPSTWAAALDGVDRLFVLAPPGHADQFALVQPFVAAALDTGRLTRLVTMTAQGVEYDESVPFRRLERFVEASGVPYVHLRPTWFAHNFHSFWGHGIREHDVIALPAADAKVAFIDARDIAAAAAAALTRDDVELGRAYALTGPAALTHAEAARVLSDATGRTIRYESISDDAFRAQLAPAGLPGDYIELMVGLFAAVRAGVAAEVSDGVEALTGTAPRPLSDYARDYRAALG